MTQIKPVITAARVEAFIASALGVMWWLISAILRGGLSGRSVCLRRALSRAEPASSPSCS